GTTGSTMTQDNMSSDEVHKNSMCKDGRCPDTGKKLDNGGNTTPDSAALLFALLAVRFASRPPNAAIPLAGCV
ncbi:protein YbgS, partial [Klebsiella pneumoniae]|uniref:protein YbgS n=1 Tax=Klebsiella pneumoniae TaxID=573 RepID=UPI0028FB7E3E